MPTDMKHVDLAWVLDELVPEAKYRHSHSYDALVATWTDARPVPTKEQILDKWDEIQSREVTQEPTIQEKVDALLDKEDGDPSKLTTVLDKRRKHRNKTKRQSPPGKNKTKRQPPTNGT